MSTFSHLFKSSAFITRVQIVIWRISLFSLVAVVGALVTVSVVRAMVSISPTKTDAFVGEHDGDGKADPGETIEYTVFFQNTGDETATGVSFSDIIDANTTLVPGSVNVSPLAIADSYDTIGNTLLDVGASTPDPAVHVSGSLFDNDVEFLSAAFGASGTRITSHTSPANGALASFDNNTGAFSYLPNPGFAGPTDTFTYTLTDSGGLTDTATVTIHIVQRVWYVKNDAPAGGLGRSTDPFDTLVEAQTASSANDTIYIYQGNGATTGQDAGILLKDGQRLLGEGVALTVLAGVNGGPNPTILRAAGNQPRVAATAGNGVSAADDIPAEIRGLSLSGTTNAIDITITDASSGTLQIKDNTIFGAGAEGIDINKAGAATLTLDVQNNIWNAGGAHTGNAFDARATSGNLRLNFSSNLNILSSATGVLLDGTGGVFTVTAFANNTVSGNTGGAGISANTVNFDGVPGGSFDLVSGGATTIGVSDNGVGGSGMVLTSVGGNLSFTDLDIVADGGVGLQASGTTPYTGSAGFQVAVGSGAATISANSGPAVNLTTVTAFLPFLDIDSTNSSSTGVSLASVSGTFSAGSGSSIVNAAGTDFSISGGTAAVTYAGMMTDDVGMLVSVVNATGGAKSFTGAITDGNDGDGSGISLTNNTGTTMTFSGGLMLSTGANPAFTATGGGTVNVCDENPCNPGATGGLVNTLTTTTGTALNVANTTIGSNNLEFRSISANGGANGIVLNSTGTSGGLVVKGDSGSSNNSSGGMIQQTTSHGISLTTTQNVSLDQMNIQNTGGSGINGVDTTNFTFTNGTINNSGNALGESNIAFNGNGVLKGNNLDGTLTVTGSTLTNAFDHGIHIENDSGTIGNAVIQNNTIASTTSTATSKGSGIQLIGTGNETTASNLIKATIDSNTVRNFPSGAGIQVNYGNSNSSGPGAAAGVAGSSTDIISITNNVARGFDAVNRFGTHAIIISVSGGNSASRSQGNFNVSNNGTVGDPIGNSLGIALGVGNNGFSTMTATINNNVIVANNTFASGGISGGNGVVIGCPTRCETPLLTLTVTNNNISQTDGNGILLVGRGTMGTANFGIRNNTVAAPLSGVRPGIRVDAGNNSAGSDDAVCLDISGNTTAGSGGHDGIGLRKQGSVPTMHDFGVEGMLATSSPAVETFVGNTGQNPGSATGTFGFSGVLLLSAAGGFSNCSTSAYQPQGIQVLAKAQPSDSGSHSQVSQPSTTVSTDSNAANSFAISSGSANSFKQASWVKTQKSTVSPSAGSGGGKPHMLVMQPAPDQSGETVDVTIGPLPAGKSVTIKFWVTVNGPALPLGTTKIVNQGTVHSNEVADVHTTNGGPTDCETGTQTCTPVDRPDTPVVSLDRASANPNKNSTVTWQIVFADPVSGLTASSFSLAQGGSLSGAALSSVTEANGPPSTTWNVTANTGTGDGTLGLNMVNDTGLSHDVTNLPFTGQVFTIDKTAPTVANVTSSTANGYYNAPDLISIQVKFSEPVIVSGTPQLTLETGATDRVVDYTSGSGTDTLTFNYTIQAGDNSADLDTVSTSALAFNGGTILDAAHNDAALTLASPGSSGSLGSNKDIVIDTTPPATVSFTRFNPLTQPNSADLLVFRVTFNEKVGGLGGLVSTNDFMVHDNSPLATTTTAIDSIGTPGGNMIFDLTLDGTDGTPGDLASFNGDVGLDFSPGMVIRDLAGNDLANVEPPSDQTYTVDNAAPVITFSSTPNDPTNQSSFSFDYGADEPVVGFTCTLSEAGSGVLVGAVSCPPPVSDSVPGNGIYTLLVEADDLAGNTGSVSFTWAVDVTQPTVTINRAAGQADPTGSSPINFTVTFSEPVSDFDDAADVTLSGTAGAAAVAISGGPSTYNVAVSGMTGDGTVIASIPAGAATDGVNLNAASTSTDNSVLYDNVAPSVTIEQAVGQTDPTNSSPINFTAAFSEDVTGFDAASDVTLSGTAGAATVNITGGPKVYNLAVSGMTGEGTVIASIPAGAALDQASRPNSASTSTDNIVTYDSIPPDTSIESSPANPTASSSATFTFTGSDDGGTGVAGFECDLDDGGFSACSNSQTYPSLSDGSHTFQVRAIDRAGNVDVTPAGFTWVVDATPPDTTIASNPSNPTNNTTASFTFTGSDGGGTGVAGFQCDLDGGGFSACAGIQTQTYYVLPDGSHTFQVAAIDAVGNIDPTPASFTWTVDTAPLSVVVSSVTTSPTNTSPIPVTVTFNEPVTGFTPSVAAGDLVITNGTDSSPAGSGATYTFNLTPSGQGPVTVYVPEGSAVDAANNWNTNSNTFSIIYDLDGPTVTINQAVGQPDPTGSSPVHFTAVFSEPVAGFATGDVTLTGTAGATTAVVTEIAPNDGTTYTVAVSGMTSDGTIIAAIHPGVAQDFAANGNAASTSTDDTVTFMFTFGTTTTITANTPHPSVVGETVTFNYSVTADPPGSGTPTGIVTITDGTDSCSASVSAGSCTIIFTDPGVKTLTAAYEGDDSFSGSTSISLNHTVNQANTTTSLTVTFGPLTFATPVTLTAAVAVTPPGAGTPTGSVRFYDGGNFLGTGTLDSNGVATLIVPSIPNGERTFTVMYEGDSNFAANQQTSQVLIPWRILLIMIYNNYALPH